MRCQECTEHATIHLTEMESGSPRSLHFCKNHAKQHLRQTGGPDLDRHFDDLVPVTVEVTQSQVDRGEPVAVNLPNGQTVNLPLPKSLSPSASLVMLLNPKGDPSRPLYELRIRVVSEHER